MKSTLFCACCLLLAGVHLGLHAYQQEPVQGSSQVPTIAFVKPDVVLSGRQTARVEIRGQALKGRSIRISDCEGKELTAKVNPGAVLTVDLPVAVLVRPCVVRLSPDENPGSSLPLAVADPQLAKLTLPPPDPNGYYSWSGQFNALYGEDQVGELSVPPNAALVGIFSDDNSQRSFVLGKGKVAVEYLKPVPSPAASRDGKNFVYLLVPGVHEEDVRWGPEDVEGFWVGVVSTDRQKLLEWQPLANMVVEPSHPLDN